MGRAWSYSEAARRLSGAREWQLFFGYITKKCFRRSIWTLLLLPSSSIYSGVKRICHLTMCSANINHAFNLYTKRVTRRIQLLEILDVSPTRGSKFGGPRESIFKVRHGGRFNFSQQRFVSIMGNHEIPGQATSGQLEVVVLSVRVFYQSASSVPRCIR